MPRSLVLSPSRAPSHVWPGVALAALALSLAGCADSARINANSYSRNGGASAPPQQQEVTGSIGTRAAPSTRVDAQPLAPAGRQAYVPLNNNNAGYASGAQGLGSYRPATTPSADVTGSVSAPPQPAGHWTWDGGSPVTVGPRDTLDVIARRHGVPAHAIVQTNGLASATAIYPGQRLVIPRYVSSAAPQAAAPQVAAPAPRAAYPAPVAAAPRGSENVHVVQPGESLMGLSRRYGVPLSTLAKQNNLSSYAKVSVGDRITIPGGARAAAPVAQVRPQAAPVQQQAYAQPQYGQQTYTQPQPQYQQQQYTQQQQFAPPQQPAPQQFTQQRAAPPIERVATVPAQNARLASQETPAAAQPESPVKEAEAVGAMPSFRWPVKGRVIAGFGSKINGVQNDGINLAVPEGTPVKAAEDGVVAYAGNELKGYGNLVLIRHSNGYVSAYANASELLVKRGDSVKRGQTIANAGQTGNVTSPQLHFEIRKGSTPVDPTKYLGG